VGGREPSVDAYADKIKQTRPLTSAALERYLLLLNDLRRATPPRHPDAGIDAERRRRSGDPSFPTAPLRRREW